MATSAVQQAKHLQKELGFWVKGLGCVDRVRAVGAVFSLGIGLRQHVVPPQPPQLFSIRV